MAGVVQFGFPSKAAQKRYHMYKYMHMYIIYIYIYIYILVHTLLGMAAEHM